jgi:transposase
MNEHAKHQYFAGFDWASNHHDIVVVDKAGNVIADFQIEHTAAGWRDWCEKITAWPDLAVAVETSFGFVVENLLQSGVTVYPVNPKSAKSFRQRKSPSGNKTDRLDAWSMADSLRTDGHAWRPLGPQDPLIEQLRILCRDEIQLIEERTALICQLRQALREYYPAALEIFDDWTAPYAWAFVERFPTADALAKAGKRAWEKFLHVHKLWRPSTSRQRLEEMAKAGEWKVSHAMVEAKSLYARSKVRQLRTLEIQLQEYRKQIEALFASHPDSEIFKSLPGAGPKIAPRLLGEIGSDRQRYHAPEGLQRVAGTAPVTFQTGKIRKVYMRRSCCLPLRHTIHLFANLSRNSSVWASTYYDQQRQRGVSHAQALRALGQRWIKIIWRMWHDHSNYDANLHLKNQIAHGSWLLKVEQK